MSDTIELSKAQLDFINEHWIRYTVQIENSNIKNVVCVLLHGKKANDMKEYLVERSGRFMPLIH